MDAPQICLCRSVAARWNIKREYHLQDPSAAYIVNAASDFVHVGAVSTSNTNNDYVVLNSAKVLKEATAFGRSHAACLYHLSPIDSSSIRSLRSVSTSSRLVLRSATQNRWNLPEA